ncbi:MAG: thiamine pyrophosphate-binding protein [Deltaproteobacteria bacterium]|nr:thiamine pyrophosphate-binding protein [Deltaproteobacteria bacterium]MBK8718143.1 thiamine pyrophosphate-binding protein [Deltaproteobacteria bacterium]MBP7292188.1 thiamine pyrophosphate-binding protein [Nannocystaceae bacterium]
MPVHEQLTMADVFLRYLRAEGARVVFGVPGGLLHPFFAAVARDPEFRLIVTRHECGAAFMADGFARTGGAMAVCAGTSGPGATNLLTGVACAYSDGVPMLVVTGQAPSHALGKGAAQETPPEDIDIVAMFKPITKYSTMIPGPARLAHHLRRALRLALTGRPGPVHLNIPVDYWDQPAVEDWFDPATYRPAYELFDRRAVSSAARRLLTARKPVILIGSGAATSDAAEHVRSLAELLPARVATTPRAKGVFPEDHPLSLGVMGIAGHSAARIALLSDDVDVLLTVGASLNETTTLNWHPRFRPSEALIQIDVMADRIARNYPVDIALVGDAQTIAIELIYHIHRLLRDGVAAQSAWRDELELTHGHEFYDAPELRCSDAVPVTPQRWRVELNAVLPEDAVVFSDIGGHMLFNVHDLCIREQQRFVLNLGFGSMGHGTAAPIGAALAEPQRPIIAIIGDACFAMQGMELLTAVEYDIPVVWIVENNQMHGITWFGSQLVGAGEPLDAVRNRRPVDIAGIARAMGLHAWVVERPRELGPAVREALAGRHPAVIEVRVAAEIAPPLGPRAQVIAGFRDR